MFAPYKLVVVLADCLADYIMVAVKAKAIGSM
jgi:hypothetical protein